ncbi:glutaredoxin family protein [Paenibacillus sp. TSA_86.1]|uniref:glutaredoxin family protein n=1 Tax=Paenibacillus sp. TSA_86.1 TaxID=3415649 RepID=UPI0040460A9A
MKKLIVYTTPNCIYCTRMKIWLKEKEIEFSEVSYTEIVDTGLRDSIQGFPFTVVIDENGYEQSVIGFNTDILQKLI